MNIGTDKKIILTDEKNNIWLFSLNESQKLYFTQSNQEGIPLKERIVDERPVVDFWVDMDENHTLHILLYTLSRYLVYLASEDGNTWDIQTLSRVTVRAQTLNDLFILSRERIHIFYIVQNAFRRSSEAIVHYIWNKSEWTGKRLWEFPSENNTRIHQIIHDQDGIYNIFFSQHIEESFKLLHSRLLEDEHWATPSLLYNSPSPFQYFHAVIDHEGRTHCCWSSNYQIYYNGIKISKSDCQNSHPCFSYHDGILSCIWLQDGIPVLYTSGNVGESWEQQKYPFSSTSLEFYYLILSHKSKMKYEMSQILSPSFPNLQYLYKDKANISVETKLINKSVSTAPAIDTRMNVNKMNDDDMSSLLSKMKSMEEALQQHTYRLHQIEEKVFNYQRSIFNLEAQTKKIMNDLDNLHGNRDQIEAIKYALENMESQLRNMQKRLVK